MNTTMNPFFNPIVDPRALSAAIKLRERLSDPTAPILVCPGVYDVLSTQIAMSLGFEALYLVSPPRSASAVRFNSSKTSPPSFPVLNNSLLTSPTPHYHAEVIYNLAPTLTLLAGDVPLIATGDTCHGGPVMTERTVHLYAQCGIAAVHVEDAMEASPPTRGRQHTHCETPAPLSVFEARVNAGVGARNAMRSNIMVMAHTTVTNAGWEEAVIRLRAAQASGADMGVLMGVKSKAEAAKAASALEGFPMMLQLAQDGGGGPPPIIYPHEAEAMGYKALVFPLAATLPAEAAIRHSLGSLKQSLQPKPKTNGTNHHGTSGSSMDMEMVTKGVMAL